jgi:hypothetical protein
LTRASNRSASWRATRRAEALERIGDLGELAHRLRELEHLPDRGLRWLERERPAQRQAHEHTPPTAEPLAHQPAEGADPGVGEDATQKLAVVCPHSLDCRGERLLIRGERADRRARRLQLGDQVGALLLRERPTNDFADQPTADGAGPVTEEMAEALKLVLLDELAP